LVLRIELAMLVCTPNSLLAIILISY